MKATLTLSIALLATVSIAPLASATILASDDFNSYTSGTALTGGAGGTGWGVGPNLWLAPSAGTTLATVNDYSGDKKVDVTLTATATTVVGGRLPGTPITQTFFASYTLIYSGVGTNVFDGNNTFGLILSDLTVPNTTVAANVLNFGARAGANAFGIRGGTAVAGSTTGGALISNTEYFLVAKLTYTAGKFDKGDLWVNPGASLDGQIAPGATLSLTAGTGVGAINSIYFRQAANSATAGGDTYRFDNLILATDWNDIVPVPEPSTLSLALLGLGGVAGLAFRRRNAERS
jgi:hypothetical protein